MSTALRIAGWKSRGLRCPDHEIVLENDRTREVHRVSLIQMPNGTGKTTTLQLLRAALSGETTAEAFGEEDIRALRKRDVSATEGEFQVRLVVDGRPVTITLTFDFNERRVRCSTTLPAGLMRGFRPPRAAQGFLRSDVIGFFVFNGELAEQLVDRRHTDAETVIDSLFQLNTFTRLRSQVEEYWQLRTTGRTAMEERGLARRRNKVRELKRLIDEKTEEQNRLEKEYQAIGELLAERDKDFKAGLRAQEEREKHIRHLERANAELRSALEQKDAIIAVIVRTIKDPCALGGTVCERLERFRRSLDQVKLPESAAREFFVELAEQDVCVCGRELDPESRQAISERAARYLGSQEVALLNAMKSDIADRTLSSAATYEQLRQELDSLREAVIAVGRHRTERNAIQAEAAKGDPNLEADHTEIQNLKAAERDLERKLREFDDPTETAGHEQTTGIAVLRRRLTLAEQKLAEITETLDIKNRRDRLIGILDDAQQRARAVIRSKVREEANERIGRLMPHNRIRIRKIEQCLLLEGQEAGSTGENLSVAYAFLASLFGRAESGLPFVVDSPANPIDLKVRGEVANLLPQLTDQFIAFTISSERSGFLGPLERAAEGQIQYLTMFRKGNAELEAQAKCERHHKESADGLLVGGSEFFRAFQLDEEE